jgi:hypothetical protein
MKGGKPHRVPLSVPALQIIKAMTSVADIRQTQALALVSFPALSQLPK